MSEVEHVGHFEDIATPLVAVLYNGTPCIVKVRELSSLQIQAIGNISLIDIEAKTPSKSWKEIASVSDLHNKIVKAALVSPSYEEIYNMIGKSSFIEDVKKRFVELEKAITKMEAGPEKSLFEERLASMRFTFDLILPNDFMAGIVEYALGSKKSEIKLVTESILMNCALMAKQCGGRPSDYCEGRLTDFNKVDIDRRAVCLLAERNKK